MKSATLTSRFFLALALSVSSAVASPSFGSEGTHDVVQNLRIVVQLSSSAKTRDQAFQLYQQLRSRAPHDARIPYAFSLVLIDQHRYLEAADALNETLRLSEGNLTAWKLSIWVAVITKEYQDALSKMETLASRMPSTTASPAGERKCEEFVGFMGRIYGFLAGPTADELDSIKRVSSEQDVVNSLTDSRRAIFHTTRQEVVSGYQAAIEQINALRKEAAEDERHYRNLQLENLSQDRQYAWNELDKIDDLRNFSKELASQERNVIASTRAHGGSLANQFHNLNYRYRNLRNPFFRPDVATKTGLVFDDEFNPKDGRMVIDHRTNERSGLNANGGYHGRSYYEHGLGDEHYADVNRREEDNDRYLARRQKQLNQRHRRIAQDQEQLVCKPVTGNTRQVAGMKAKANALATYVSLPTSIESEIKRIVDSYL